MSRSGREDATPPAWNSTFRSSFLGSLYRFPAVAADKEGFHVIWIHALDTSLSLRHAQLAFESNVWSLPTLIGPEICACCWNTLRVGDDGALYALYRDHQPSRHGSGHLAALGAEQLVMFSPAHSKGPVGGGESGWTAPQI